MTSRFRVIVGDNAGVRTEEPAVDRPAAEALAKRRRTVDVRTVKIADAFGSADHWSRTVRPDRNHWSRRAVADEAFD